MYLMDAVRVLLRRWYVLLVGAVLIGAAGAAALVVVSPEYQASGQVLLLLSPEASGTETPSNPLLNLQEGLEVTATFIAGNVGTEEVQKEMAAAGFSSSYSVSLSPGAGPLLVITTNGIDAGNTLATRDEVVRRLKAELLAIQSDPRIPARQIIQGFEYGVTQQVAVLQGSRIRALAVIGAVGVVLVTVVAFVLDRALTAPGRRKRRDDSPTDEESPTDRDLPTDRESPTDRAERTPMSAAAPPAPAVVGASDRFPSEDAPSRTSRDPWLDIDTELPDLLRSSAGQFPIADRGDVPPRALRPHRR